MDLENRKRAILDALQEGHARGKKPGGFHAPPLDEEAAWADLNRAVRLWEKGEARHRADLGERRPRGRPRGSPLQRLIDMVGGVFFQRTGSEPGVTRRTYSVSYIDDEGMSQERTLSELAEGPFVDFVQLIAASAGFTCTPEGVDNALEKVRAPFTVPKDEYKGSPAASGSQKPVKNVRRNQSWFLDLNQPIPSDEAASEVFGATVAKLTLGT